MLKHINKIIRVIQTKKLETVKLINTLFNKIIKFQWRLINHLKTGKIYNTCLI